MAFIIPNNEDSTKIYGKVMTEGVSTMAKCACVSCNSCTCACSCRGISTETDLWV